MAVVFLASLASLLSSRLPAQSVAALVGVSALRPPERWGPAPNYIAALKRGPLWKRFPLKVCFLRDANFASARVAMARNGFSRWVVATEGLIDFEVSDDPGTSDVLVVFDPKTPNGLTRRGLDRAKRLRAVITIGARPGLQTDIEAIAAHEFGHALGIDGHSNRRRDLMYPMHYQGTHGRPSPRDLNTMAALYPQIRPIVTRSSPTAIGSGAR